MRQLEARRRFGYWIRQMAGQMAKECVSEVKSVCVIERTEHWCQNPEPENNGVKGFWILDVGFSKELHISP